MLNDFLELNELDHSVLPACQSHVHVPELCSEQFVPKTGQGHDEAEQKHAHFVPSVHIFSLALVLRWTRMLLIPIRGLHHELHPPAAQAK